MARAGFLLNAEAVRGHALRRTARRRVRSAPLPRTDVRHGRDLPAPPFSSPARRLLSNAAAVGQSPGAALCFPLFRDDCAQAPVPGPGGRENALPRPRKGPGQTLRHRTCAPRSSRAAGQARHALRHGQRLRSARGDHAPEAPGKTRRPPSPSSGATPVFRPASAGGPLPAAWTRLTGGSRAERRPSPPRTKKKAFRHRRKASVTFTSEKAWRPSRGPGTRPGKSFRPLFQRSRPGLCRRAPAVLFSTVSGRSGILRSFRRSPLSDAFPVLFYCFRTFLPGREGASFPGADDYRSWCSIRNSAMFSYFVPGRP